MIRRGFWVATGAVLGVTGYRRITRLTRMFSGPSGSLARPGPVARQPMLTTPGRPASVRPGTRHVARSQVARAIAAAGFVRDVRDGMAEYWDLHRGEPDSARTGRTLGAQSDRTWSGEGAQGHREP
jgi:hypothetical protein